MRKILNTIKNILIIILLLGFITAGIDYLRINSGEVPIFNIKSYNERSKIETFRGLFYISTRKVTISETEDLTDSTKITFKILVFDLKVPRQYKEPKTEYTLETKTTENCTEPAKLYYADKNIKVYTYCLDSIKVKENNKEKELAEYLKKDSLFTEDIDSKLDYTGLANDKTTLMFQNKNDSFTNEGISLYRCHKENINDVYFAPKDTPMQADFCTYKDDDFKFIFEILDESANNTTDEKNTQPEVIYEDENYTYQFDTPKSNYIFITTPAVRGKEEQKIPLMTIINNKLLTIEELENKGLKITKKEKKKN